VVVANSPGTIDSDYRGEIKVLLHNLIDTHFEIKKGERIAQGCIQPVHNVDFLLVDELTYTQRGDSGFGSSGL
jgi:dUTP pyrophosphatase